FNGGANAKKTIAPGDSPPPTSSPPAATSTARTRAPRKTSHTCRPPNSPPTSSRRSSASRKSWPTSRSCSQDTAHELLRRQHQGRALLFHRINQSRRWPALQRAGDERVGVNAQ